MKKHFLSWVILVMLANFFCQAVCSAQDVGLKKKSEEKNIVQDLLELPFKTTEGLAGAVFEVGNVIAGSKRLPSPLPDPVARAVTSTTVITEKDIQLVGARNLPEAMQEVPGVALSDLVGNGEEPTLDFRGFNEGQDFVYLLDGVRLNEPKSNNINYPLIPVNLLDRIEVNRSGSSFLYGEGAMGGAANLASKKPEEGRHAKIYTCLGGFGEWGDGFEVSAREGAKSVFAAGDLHRVRGFRQNTSVEKGDLYTKLSYDVTDRSALTAWFLYADARLDRSGSIRESFLRAQGPEATERSRNFADLETNLAALDYRWSIADDVIFSSNLFRRRTSELSVANFATFETNDNELDLTVDTWGATAQMDQSHEALWGLTEGLLLGVDILDNGIDEEDFGRSKATLRRLGQTVDAESEKKSTGFFGKTTLSWNDRLGGYYGVRYDKIDFTNTDRLNTGNNVPSEISKWSHAFGLSYDATKHLALSAQVSRSFRAPTLSDLYSNPLFGGNPSLKPEEGSNYEIGAKWHPESWLVSWAGFVNHLKNEIGFDPGLADGTFLFGRNGNFGKTQRLGVETSVEKTIRPWLRLRGNHTTMDARFESNDNSGTQKSGDHIPMVPRNRWTASILGSPTKDWDITGSMVSVSKQVLTNDLTNDSNGRRLPSYTVFNLRTQVRLKGWELFFEIKNLFDEHYEIGGSLGGGSVLDNFFVPAPGRSYNGGASYRF